VAPAVTKNDPWYCGATKRAPPFKTMVLPDRCTSMARFEIRASVEQPSKPGTSQSPIGLTDRVLSNPSDSSPLTLSTKEPNPRSLIPLPTYFPFVH
jgi:hypothetical protein